MDVQNSWSKINPNNYPRVITFSTFDQKTLGISKPILNNLRDFAVKESNPHSKQFVMNVQSFNIIARV